MTSTVVLVLPDELMPPVPVDGELGGDGLEGDLLDETLAGDLDTEPLAGVVDDDEDTAELDEGIEGDVDCG